MALNMEPLLQAVINGQSPDAKEARGYARGLLLETFNDRLERMERSHEDREIRYRTLVAKGEMESDAATQRLADSYELVVAYRNYVKRLTDPA